MNTFGTKKKHVSRIKAPPENKDEMKSCFVPEDKAVPDKLLKRGVMRAEPDT